MESILPWIALVLVLNAAGGHGFYLPRVAPADFHKFDAEALADAGPGEGSIQKLPKTSHEEIDEVRSELAECIQDHIYE